MKSLQNVNKKENLLSLNDIVTFDQLELKAKNIVEGFISGLHKSPHHGFSVEFVQHKSYTPGDEIRNLDWRVYARTDRWYIKQFEEETNTQIMLACDLTGSMDYGTEIKKSRILAELTASLTWLALRQNDAVGALFFSNDGYVYLPPSSKPVQFKNIVKILVAPKYSAYGSVSDCLRMATARLKKRGIFVFLSDFLESEKILEAMEQIIFKNHELILFNIYSPEEEIFPFKGMIKFIDLETKSEIIADAGIIRPLYLEKRNNFIKNLKQWAVKHKVDFVDFATTDHPNEILRKYLIKRLSFK